MGWERVGVRESLRRGVVGGVLRSRSKAASRLTEVVGVYSYRCSHIVSFVVGVRMMEIKCLRGESRASYLSRAVEMVCAYLQHLVDIVTSLFQGGDKTSI